MRTVAGVFPTEVEAEKTKRDLKAIGISIEEILVTGADEKVSAHQNMAACAASGAGWLLAALVRQIVKQHSRASGAGVGALVGAVFGAVGGLITHATRSSLVSHINFLVVVPCGILIGAAAGALAAWTYSLGVSHEPVAFAVEAVREHGFVVAAHVSGMTEPKAIRVMNEHHAANLRTDADPWRASGWKGPHPYEPKYPSDSEFAEREMPREHVR